MRNTALIAILVFSSVFATGGTPFLELTPNLEKAYTAGFDLKFEKAQGYINVERRENPDNQLVHLFENYIDFLTVYMNEDEVEFKELAARKNVRIQHIKSAGKDSPWYLYAQAEMNLQWALARVKFKQYIKAFREVSRAYDQLDDNVKKYPDFVANKKSLGILKAMLGSIPKSYQLGAKLLGGMKGDIVEGRKEIEEVLAYSAQQPFLFEAETQIMYAFLLLHLNNEHEQAWQAIQTNRLKPEKSPLACFAVASVAMYSGHNDRAIDILQKCPNEPGTKKFYHLEFMLGWCKLRRMDADADFHLLNYVNYYKGRNFIKEAYQKLAWHELLHGRTQGYDQFMELCIKRGYEMVDEDKNAMRQAQLGIRPNADLLKARLLFDGNYLDKALDAIPQEVYGVKDRLEKTYRMGRIHQAAKRFDEALTNYTKTINVGADLPFYYACNAALQSGIIYEGQKDYVKARQYYKRCMQMKPAEYGTSLHQKAKAGINRIKRL